MKSVSAFKGIPPLVASIIEDRIYFGVPISKLSKKYSITQEKIKGILESAEYREYQEYLKREKTFVLRGKYNRLAKASLTAIKEILETSHVIDVVDERSGEVVGKRVSADIMKIKEKVASDILQNVGARKNFAKKGPVIQFNQQINNRERGILEENHKKEIEELLNKCKMAEVSNG